MRTLVVLLFISGCGDAIRNGMVAGPYYDACMKRVGADRSDAEADAVCIKRARQQAQEAMEPDSETVCHSVFGTLKCEHYDYSR